MKCTSREAAVRSYGPIDFSGGHWPDQSKHMVMFEIASGKFPNWVVGGTKMLVKHIFINKDLVAPLSAALISLVEHDCAKELKTFDGCFNIRMVRGSSDHFSAHSYGLALDLNCNDNPLGATKSKFSDTFVKCFTDAGFDWGGNFSGRKDPMHFSFCWEHK